MIDFCISVAHYHPVYLALGLLVSCLAAVLVIIFVGDWFAIFLGRVTARPSAGQPDPEPQTIGDRIDYVAQKRAEQLAAMVESLQVEKVRALRELLGWRCGGRDRFSRFGKTHNI